MHDTASAVPTADPLPRGFKYSPAMDGLRALAILSVLVGHSHYGYMLAQGGHIGVDMFFVLSGFLITSILAFEFKAAGRIDLRKFYARRFLRLIPALVFFLAITGLLSLYFDPEHNSRLGQSIVACLFYYSNLRYLFWRGEFPVMYNNLWSLAVEEQYYLVWPVVLMALLRQDSRAAARNTLVLCVALTIWQGWLSLHAPFERIYLGTDTRANELLLGAFVALIPFAWPGTLRHGPLGRSGPLLALGVLLVSVEAVRLPMSQDQPFRMYLNLPAVLATGYLCWAVIWQPSSWLKNLLARPLLIHIGKLSYSLYLWHWAIFMLLVPNWNTRLSIHMLTEILVCVAMAELSYRFVETPFLRLKTKFNSL